MKKNKFLKLIFLLLFVSPFHAFAQQEQDITGLWKGSLYDDTTKQYIPYELAISDDDGKLSGYSYSVFKTDSSEEIGLKTIKIKRKDDKIIVEDVNLIANTYSIAPAKKVKKIIEFTLTVKDSVLIMSGRWTTNWTKEYHPVTGSVEVQRKNDTWKDEPLLKKLDEMKLADKLSFNQPEKKEEPVAAIATFQPPDVVEKNSSTQTTVNIDSSKAVAISSPAKKMETKEQPVISDSSKAVVISTPNEKVEKVQTKVTPVITDSAKTVAISSSVKEIKKPEIKQADIVAAEKDSIKTIAVNTPEIKKITPVIIIPPPAAEAAKRTTQTMQTISYGSDSLTFTIYDNGIVDGDTVSILMNNSLLFSKAGLSEKPITKTVYTKDIPDSLQLVWYAENLGSIPPNTGLLIIMDGKIRHEIFFSADLHTNAAIILRRNKKE